jgi:hypothetical protein
MIPLNNKISLQVAEQLPEFVRDDVNYQTFVSFIEAYYAWLETTNSANSLSTIATASGQGVSYGSKNILNYVDVDNTLDDFVAYFINDFLPYIPEDALTDKRKLLKISKELYKTKGTEKSYKFLFRALYNSEAETYNTSDQILKASDGKWIIPKSVKINSLDEKWLLVNNLRLFGETSKAYAVIDYAKRVGTKTEIFISGLQRQFGSGEFVRVVDNNNFDVYYLDGELYFQNQDYSIPTAATTITEKILGFVETITINPNYRGLFYNPGDPVVAYGGLNPDIAEPSRVSAEVGATTKGSVSSIVVVNPSNGYRLPPNTSISITGGGGSGAAAQVSLLDSSKQTIITLATSNTLGSMANVWVGNSTIAQTYTRFAVTANTNSRLIDALTFKTYTVAPIASVQMLNNGANYDSIPTIEAVSTYATSNGATTQTADFRNLGILQPIQIVNGGINYSNSNTISIIGGTGYGAYANIVVNTAGSIISANYVYSASNTIQTYPLGGLGYSATSLPTVNVNSTTGSNASLVVTGIMGFGATFSPSTDSIGSISSIIINNSGSDYISTPNVSLKVADIAVSNVSLLSIPVSGDIVYQNDSSNATVFTAYVDSVTKLTTAAPYNPLNDVYRIRTYNYTGVFSQSLNIRVNSSLTSRLIPQTYYLDSVGSPTSIKTYGDGKALADAGFVGGIITGEGKYLNNDGQISTYGLVLESKDYNNYTYVLSTEQAIKTYRDLVLNLLHPSGMRLRGRNLIKTGAIFNSSVTDNFQKGNTLAYVAGSAAYATLQVPVGTTTTSNNIIKFTNVISGNIGNTIFANDLIKFSATNKINAYSVITQVDWANNQVYMTDNVFLTFANVAYASVNATSNIININTMTGQFDGNFGVFGPITPSNNIIFVGDSVSFNGVTYYTVTKVFANGNFSINNSTLGPIANTLISVNKNANTQSVMIYGDVGLYEYPQLTTEDGYSLLTESGNYLLIG